MTDLLIEPTEKTPGVDLSFGILSFYGCSIVEDPRSFFDPINTWVKRYLKEPAEETVVTIKLEYIDSVSTQALFQILKQLKTLEKKGLVLLVNWYYEYGDIEMIELGEVVQGRLEMEFDFIEMRIGG